MTGALVMDNQEQVRFREASGNGTNFIALQAPASVASDKTITLPDVTGTVVTTGDTGSVTSTMILDGTILNADINASAAIAGTKVAPDFGSQNVVTTGTATAASLNPTGSSVPTNGVYLPAANSVAISTNGTGRLFVDASGKVGINISSPDGTTHVHTATAGAVTANTSADDLVVENSGAGGISILTPDANNGSIFFGTPSDAAGAAIRWNYSTGEFGIGPDKVGGYLRFNSDDGTERMRLDSSGRLGLGTSSPIGLLHVDAGSSDNFTYLQARGANALESSILFLTKNSSGANRGGSIGHDGNTQTLYLTGDTSGGSTQHVAITSGGLVGIGTTTAEKILTVLKNGDSGLYIKSADTNHSNLQLGVDTANSYSFIQSGSAGSGSALNMAFFVGSTERFRCDTSGRLLIGTSTARANFLNSNATAQLQVEGVGSDPSRVSIVGNFATATSSTSGALLLARSGASSLGSNTLVANGNQLGLISFAGADGTEFVNAATITCEVDGTPGANDMPGRIVLSTTSSGASSPTERMRISNSGLIDTFSSSGSNTFSVRNSNAAGTTVNLITGLHTATTTQNGTLSFIVRTNGNVQNTNNSYGSISDLKLKENIVDANSQWDDVKDLRVVNYNFKEGQTHTQIGLIAQEVELVSPGLVSESPDRDEDGNETGEVTKSVNYSVLYMKAVKALQEAMERIETLEAKVAALEAQ
jgi:hypothetical protein